MNGFNFLIIHPSYQIIYDCPLKIFSRFWWRWYWRFERNWVPNWLFSWNRCWSSLDFTIFHKSYDRLWLWHFKFYRRGSNFWNNGRFQITFESSPWAWPENRAWFCSQSFQVLIFCVEFQELSHITRDLSQAE